MAARKLTDEQVADIRREYTPYSKSRGTTGLARQYGVSCITVHKIITWQERVGSATPEEADARRAAHCRRMCEMHVRSE